LLSTVTELATRIVGPFLFVLEQVLLALERELYGTHACPYDKDIRNAEFVR